LAIISTALLPLLRKNKEIIRIPAFAIIACLSLWLGLWVSIRPPKADEIVTPSIVAVRHISPGYQKTKHEWFNARAPSTPPDADIDVVWSFSKLEIDGRNLSPWTRRGPSDAPGSFQIQSALVRKLGNTFLNPRAEPAYYFPTIAILPTEFGPLSALDIAFDLSETHYRWEVVVDIPLREGASAQLPDCRWIIDYYRPEIALQADGNVRTDTVLKVAKSSVDLWLQSKPHWNPHHRPDDDSPCIVDRITGAVHPIGFDARGFSIGSASHRVRRLQSWDIASWLRSASVDPPRELRFVVLRPTAVRRISHRWKSPGPVGLWSSFVPNSMEPQTEPYKGINLLEWLGKNPVPPPDASAAEAESWIRQFHSLLRANGDQIRDRDEYLAVLAIFAPFVTHHPQVVLAVAEEHRDLPWLLESAIRKYLPRDVPKRFPEYATRGLLMASFIEQGWAGDLAMTARDHARRGLAWKVSPILLAVPQEIGLTETEWLEYVHLNPEAVVYHALAGKVLARERIDEAVDEILESFRIQPSNHRISPGLELALARGRAEAPRWLKEDFEARIAASAGHSFEILKNHFVLPELDHLENGIRIREGQLGWFLAADPDGFEFDPATRKYQLRNDP
jgi:hypothetical protein